MEETGNLSLDMGLIFDTKIPSIQKSTGNANTTFFYTYVLHMQTFPASPPPNLLHIQYTKIYPLVSSPYGASKPLSITSAETGQVARGTGLQTQPNLIKS